MRIKNQILIAVSILASVILAEQFTPWDIKIQNLFFDFKNCSWLVNKNVNTILHFFFYSGVKALLVALGVLAIGLFAYSFKNKKLKSYRYPCLLFILTMLFVPLILAGAKKYTNVYCPAQLEVYCGNKPYAKVLSRYPSDFDPVSSGKGRCFPAGHASGGFALMALFFCFKRRKLKIAGLITGLALGWIMGLYQMMRGEHFLSHTLVTMLGAWIIILLITFLLNKLQQKFPSFFRTL